MAIKKITMYATDRNGDGMVKELGTFETFEDISIKCGMFADDVVIDFDIEYEREPESID